MYLILIVALLAGCEPSSSYESIRSADVTATDGGADLGSVRSRLSIYYDSYARRLQIYDNQTQSICAKEPLCDSCIGPDWGLNPEYCVPDGSKEGIETALAPFVIDYLFTDAACLTTQVFGILNVQVRRGAVPSVAYRFDEFHKTARVYRVTQLGDIFPTMYRLNTSSRTCVLATTRDISDAMYIARLYVQGEEIPFADLVPWTDVQKAFGIP